jgi:hypothetical protein
MKASMPTFDYSNTTIDHRCITTLANWCECECAAHTYNRHPYNLIAQTHINISKQNRNRSAKQIPNLTKYSISAMPNYFRSRVAFPKLMAAKKCLMSSHSICHKIHFDGLFILCCFRRWLVGVRLWPGGQVQKMKFQTKCTHVFLRLFGSKSSLFQCEIKGQGPNFCLAFVDFWFWSWTTWFYDAKKFNLSKMLSRGHPFLV